MPDTTAQFHLELRTSRGKYLTDLAVADAEHAVHAMRHLAEVSPGTYGPYGSHRLVLTGPDHAVMPVVDPASFRGAKRAAAQLLNKLGGGA